MKSVAFFIVTVSIGLYLTSSTSDKYKSESYFKDNESAIVDLLHTFTSLNQKQPFAFGFLDNDYKDYAVQIYTDSVRYMYKSDVTINQHFKELQSVAIDSTSIAKVAQQLVKAKGIWIESKEIYLSGFLQKGTIISF